MKKSVCVVVIGLFIYPVIYAMEVEKAWHDLAKYNPAILEKGKEALAHNAMIRKSLPVSDAVRQKAIQGLSSFERMLDQKMQALTGELEALAKYSAATAQSLHTQQTEHQDLSGRVHHLEICMSNNKTPQPSFASHEAIIYLDAQDFLGNVRACMQAHEDLNNQTDLMVRQLQVIVENRDAYIRLMHIEPLLHIIRSVLVTSSLRVEEKNRIIKQLDEVIQRMGQVGIPDGLSDDDPQDAPSLQEQCRVLVTDLLDERLLEHPFDKLHEVHAHIKQLQDGQEEMLQERELDEASFTQRMSDLEGRMNMLETMMEQSLKVLLNKDNKNRHAKQEGRKHRHVRFNLHHSEHILPV